MVTAVEANSYAVQIQMDDNTVQGLTRDGYHLYAFRAVKGQGTGSPVVWQSRADLYKTMDIQWETQYGAYFAAPDQSIITGRTDVKVNLGQELVILPDGTYQVVDTKKPTSIEVSNKKPTSRFSSGISEFKDGKFNPLCSFNLPANMLLDMAPIQQLVLIFATDVINTGTVIKYAMSNGICIDLTAKNNRVVTYVDNVWGSSDTQGITLFDADSDLNPYLINPLTQISSEASLLSRVEILEKRVNRIESKF